MGYMKYLNLMRKLSVVVFVLFLSSISLAQKTSNSPYSSFGLGESGGMDHAALIGMGNSTISVNDSSILNFYNPSTYSSLAKGQPLFSLGVSTRLSQYSENGIKSDGSVTSVQHFAIAFPFAKRFGLAFGLKPYSRRGYEFSSRQAVAGDSIYYNYSGSGGVNEAFAGFSVRALNYKGAKVSIGGNFGYLFGNVVNTRKSGLIISGLTNYPGGVGMKSIRVRAFHYEIGLNYLQKLNDKHTVGLSAVLEPSQKLNGSYIDELYYAGNINNPNVYDTLHYNDSLSGSITIAPTYSIGLNYNLNFVGRKGSTKELNSSLSVHLNYSSTNWSSFSNNFEPNFTNNFLNTSKITFGIQYTPEVDFITNKVNSKFHHRMKYRAGVYNFTLPYQTNNEQVTDFGTTFGFGIPIVVQNSLSSINLGFAIGNRGTSDANALKERYYGINIGISIAPGSDRWFTKRKLN